MNKQNIFTCKNGHGIATNPNTAIFPIMKQLNKRRWQIIGTGFFIANNGLFATAKHVLNDVINSRNQQTRPIAAFNFPENKQYIIRPILKAFMHNKADVAIGYLAAAIHNKTKQPLISTRVKLTKRPPAIGDQIHTYAYPESRAEEGKIIFSPNYYEGEITEIHPDGRDSVMLPTSCFRSNMIILGGASGGPVFNTDGKVFGINSTGWEGVKESYVSDIKDLLSITIEDIQLSQDDKNLKVMTIEELASIGHITID